MREGGSYEKNEKTGKVKLLERTKPAKDTGGKVK